MDATNATVRSGLASLFVLTVGAACHSSSPALVRSWGFSGTVTQVWDPGDVLQGNAYDGMKVTGHFGTSATTDVDSRPNLGHFDEGDAWILAPGFGANPNGSFDFFTWNNAVSVPGDQIRVDQGGVPSDFVISSVDLAAKGVKVVGVRIEFEDGSANALAGDHLPTHLDVADWDRARFWITASTWSHDVWYVLGRVDEIWEE